MQLSAVSGLGVLSKRLLRTSRELLYWFSSGTYLLARGRAPAACFASERHAGSGSRSLRERGTGGSSLAPLCPSAAETPAGLGSHTRRSPPRPRRSQRQPPAPRRATHADRTSLPLASLQPSPGSRLWRRLRTYGPSPGQSLAVSRLLQGQEETGCASGSANRDPAELLLNLGCCTPRNSRFQN